MQAAHTLIIPVRDYDLGATLQSGQSFVWRRRENGWEGVVDGHWVHLESVAGGIKASLVAGGDGGDWTWLRHYLQTDVDLAAILATFPPDPPLQRSVSACRGLRLLRQDPWECLASFILSSTKQIVQIQQIVAALRRCAGIRVRSPADAQVQHAFPSPAAVAAAGEDQLRACKMGFRAPNLLATARLVVEKKVDLAALSGMTLGEARAELLRCPGVGAKIADCVLLFAYGFPQAFPVDVWVMRAMRRLYFPRRQPKPERLRRFIAGHFGPQAGYAQQYLFHYMRVIERSSAPAPPLAA